MKIIVKQNRTVRALFRLPAVGGQPPGPLWTAVSGPSPGSRGTDCKEGVSALLSGCALPHEQASFCSCIKANVLSPATSPGTRARPLTMPDGCSRSAPGLLLPAPAGQPGRSAPLLAGPVAENSKQNCPPQRDRSLHACNSEGARAPALPTPGPPGGQACRGLRLSAGL